MIATVLRENGHLPPFGSFDEKRKPKTSLRTILELNVYRGCERKVRCAQGSAILVVRAIFLVCELFDLFLPSMWEIRLLHRTCSAMLLPRVQTLFSSCQSLLQCL